MNRKCVIFRIGFPAALFWISAGFATASAQNFEQVAPKPVPQVNGPAPEIVPPAPEAPAAGQDDQQLLPELKGLVLVDSAAKIQQQGVSTAGVMLDNLPLLDDPVLRAQLMAYLGKPATFGDLKKISQTVTAWYAGHDRPFVDVVFPAQDINSGVVQAVVTEFHLGQVRVEGNNWFSSELLHGYVRGTPGQTLDLKQLNEDVTALNENPFRRVSVVAERSATPGDTDLVLRTEDRLPLRVYAGYDNTGTTALGYDRWNLGINWGNAFGLDQQLSYQFTSSSDFWDRHSAGPGRPGAPSLEAHSLDYVVPLPWRDKLAIFGSYSQAVPRLGPDLGLIGITGQASLRYIAALPYIELPFLGAGARVTQDLQAGFDFKSSNNDLSFGGVNVSNVTTQIDQFPLIYDASINTAYGQTSLSNSFVWSPGNLSALNRDELFREQANSPFAAAKYVYDTLVVTETTRLPFDMSWIMKIEGQIADHNLLPSEQLGAGGDDTVRGYHERAANGSVGVLLSEELRSPPFSPLRGFLPAAFSDQMQLLAFWDYATVRDQRHTEDTPASIQLASVGAGLRYTVSRFVDFRLDYGRQLLRPPGATSLGGVTHVALTIGY